MLSFGNRKKSSSGDHSLKSIGCMSGIFHLLHSRTLDRKRLTQAGKRDPNPISARQLKDTVTTNFSDNVEKQKKKKKKNAQQLEPKLPAAPATDLRQLSCSNPRSPTLPAEMRRRGPEVPMSRTEKSQQGKPGVVARLMGLDSFPAAAELRRPRDRPETASEKRRRILGALEKCDEDLRTLRRIIETIQSGETCEQKPVVPPVAPPVPAAGMAPKGGRTWMAEVGLPENLTVNSPRHGKRCTDVNCEQPSPVSVLDNRTFHFQEDHTPTKERDKCEPEVKQYLKDIFNRSFPVRESKYQRLFRDAYAQPLDMSGSKVGGAKTTPYTGSVNEDAKLLLKDCDRWERVELQKIGLALESGIYGSLMEEIINELGYYCRPSLVFFKSRKRLCF